MTRRRSTGKITLVLIGTAALGACGDDGMLRRDVYSSLEDCRADWDRAERCEPAGQGGTSGTSGRFYGPYYRVPSGDSSGLGSRPGSRAIGAINVARGGFGSSSAFHSSGG